MNLIIINLLFAIVSVVFFFSAPQGYSYDFCCWIAGLFTLQNILYFCFDDKKNLFGFEFFFALSFGITNFVYPVFYYPIHPDIWQFAIPYNHLVICKATAIAYLGYTFYMLGITKLLTMNREKPNLPSFKFNINHFLFFFLITVVSFGLYLAFGGLKAIQSVYSGSGDIREVGIYSYFNNLFAISCYLMAIFVFKLDKTKMVFYIIILAFCMLLILTTGSRALVLGLGLIILVGFNNNVRKFSIWEALLLVCAGAFVLFFIMKVRKVEFGERWLSMLQNLHVTNLFDVFSDLIINNRNLYVLVDYANTHDLTYLHGMLVDIFSPIPGLTGVLTQMCGEPVELISGGTLPTYLALGADSSYGLGTNMIGEAYRSFGLIGVMVCCFLIGYVIKRTFYASRYNVYAYVIYYLFVSHAVMYPRAPLLFNPRTVVWSLLLVFLVYAVTKKGQPNKYFDFLLKK